MGKSLVSTGKMERRPLYISETAVTSMPNLDDGFIDVVVVTHDSYLLVQY